MALNINSLQSNSALRQASREQLKGKWGLPIGLCFVIYLILSAPNSIPGASLAVLIISGPLELGLLLFFLKLVRNEPVEFNIGFKGFNNFGNALAVYLLRLLFIVLWSMLFIIPGIIKALSYSQAMYHLADNPKIEASQAIAKSRKMMDGAKGKLFCLYFSFIGWGFLCLLTFGIGFLWLIPYIHTASANFYVDLKKNYKDDDVKVGNK